MVDAVVSFAAKTVGGYLIQEAKALRGVRDEVESLKTELEWMQCFVKGAEAKQGGNDMIRQWVYDIRDIAYDAEDVLDRYILDVAPNKWNGLGPLIYSKVREQFYLHRIGKEIEALKRRLGDVSRRTEMYGLRSIISDSSRTEADRHDLQVLRHLRRTPSYAFEEKPVGVEDDTDVLLAKLLDKEPRRLIISIFGMGGLGKTTLAKKLYHKNEVKNKFHCSAWVSVSQDYTIRELLLRIIRSFKIITTTEELVKESAEDLERCLFKSLQGKSYLMVLDDIWRKEDWESLKRSFPDNKNGSRVIITTRIREVAERSDENTYAHKLRFLSAKESWDLFCEKAFHGTTRENVLENLGREMVEKCDGLPLAIVVLGGLLSTKRPQEWREVRHHIWRYLRDDSIHISHLMDLSFNDLSHQLKLCFLYLSVFPEDFEIEIERLIRKLVAEGFIPQDEDRTMEEVAKNNLDQLINRSLVQVEKRSWGRVSTCRVHDLLRDLVIQKGKELNFIHICDGLNDPNWSSIMPSCRRQVIHGEIPCSLRLHHSNSLSRSILCFNHQGRPCTKQDLAALFRRSVLLRVFDINNFEYGPLPQKIGKLIHLRYLRVNCGPRAYARRTGVRDCFWKILTNDSPKVKLASSILNFQKLQTLELSDTSGLWKELPTEIYTMQELRHLIGNFRGTLRIENLTNLQTLKYVQSDDWNNLNPAKLVNLQQLWINEEGGSGKEVFSFESIAKLKSLRLLSVGLLKSHSFASLQPLSHCQRLVDLRLSGRMEKLPDDMHVFLQNLECLLLSVPNLEEDPMPALEMLPKLTILDLQISLLGFWRLSCRSSKGFPLLEILQMKIIQLDVRGSVEWKVEDGALSMLRGLKIEGIRKREIPKRLRSIPPPAERECEHSWFEAALPNSPASRRHRNRRRMVRLRPRSASYLAITT